MNAATIFSGPGKIYYNSVALFANGEQGEIRMAVAAETDEVASALAGHVDETQANVLVRITTDPVDNWGSLGTLFPAGVTTPAIGTRFGASNTAAKIWTADQRLFTIENAFVSRHPALHLGVGQPLYRGLEITGLIANNTELGSAGSLYAIATGAADPGGQFTLSDFIRGAWTGAWGSGAGPTGFGGDGGAAMQAEDEWVVQVAAKYKPLAVQKLVRAYELSSVAVMCKVRPVGPTQANIDAALLLQQSRGLGARLGASGQGSLILTGPSGKTVTIYNAALKTVGYDFGGNKLANDEVAFVTGATFSGGAIQPLIAFSA
jgi:hypothetical protein